MTTVILMIITKLKVLIITQKSQFQTLTREHDTCWTQYVLDTIHLKNVSFLLN